MNYNRLTALVIFMLGLTINPVMAESGPKNTEPEKTNSTAAASQQQAWGDPEEESETVWTWFGMGYEMRNRSSQSLTNPVEDNGDAGSNDGGHTQKNK